MQQQPDSRGERGVYARAAWPVSVSSTGAPAQAAPTAGTAQARLASA